MNRKCLKNFRMRGNDKAYFRVKNGGNLRKMKENKRKVSVWELKSEK